MRQGPPPVEPGSVVVAVSLVGSPVGSLALMETAAVEPVSSPVVPLALTLPPVVAVAPVVGLVVGSLALVSIVSETALGLVVVAGVEPESSRPPLSPQAVSRSTQEVAARVRGSVIQAMPLRYHERRVAVARGIHARACARSIALGSDQNRV